MSNIFHKIEHEVTHAAKEVGHAVEGIATQKTAEAIIDVLTSPEAIEVEEVIAEVIV